MSYNSRKRYKKSCKLAIEQLKSYKNQGYRIIYIDETMITKSTIQKKEFTTPYHCV